MKLLKENISSIKLCLKQWDTDFMYKPPTIRPFRKERPEGFLRNWHAGDFTFYSMDEIDQNYQYIIDDYRVYYSPHIDFKMVNGDHFYKWFDTQAAAQTFYDNLKGYIEI